ncbi:unnamed protein product [Fasciola hepatica]|uniref:Uncharacterized protein n=1 Tax=Fasciola hepatica TaxID=6192 RepID=A0ABC9HGS6_FASHE|nr:unnamed protein product [Fasciola hepatica]
MTSSRHQSLLTPEHISAIEELQLRPDLLILRPDKGSGAVLMDRNDYEKKMESVLDDPSKFVREDNCDDPKELEQRISTEVQFLLEGHFINESTAHHLKPKGTQTPQLCGLPKLHKPGVPL